MPAKRVDWFKLWRMEGAEGKHKFVTAKMNEQFSQAKSFLAASRVLKGEELHLRVGDDVSMNIEDDVEYGRVRGIVHLPGQYPHAEVVRYAKSREVIPIHNKSVQTARDRMEFRDIHRKELFASTEVNVIPLYAVRKKITVLTYQQWNRYRAERAAQNSGIPNSSANAVWRRFERPLKSVLEGLPMEGSRRQVFFCSGRFNHKTKAIDGLRYRELRLHTPSSRIGKRQRLNKLNNNDINKVNGGEVNATINRRTLPRRQCNQFLNAVVPSTSQKTEPSEKVFSPPKPRVTVPKGASPNTRETSLLKPELVTLDKISPATSEFTVPIDTEEIRRNMNIPNSTTFSDFAASTKLSPLKLKISLTGKASPMVLHSTGTKSPSRVYTIFSRKSPLKTRSIVRKSGEKEILGGTGAKPLQDNNRHRFPLRTRPTSF